MQRNYSHAQNSEVQILIIKANNNREDLCYARKFEIISWLKREFITILCLLTQFLVAYMRVYLILTNPVIIWLISKIIYIYLKITNTKVTFLIHVCFMVQMMFGKRDVFM